MVENTAPGGTLSPFVPKSTYVNRMLLMGTERAKRECQFLNTASATQHAGSGNCPTFGDTTQHSTQARLTADIGC